MTNEDSSDVGRLTRLQHLANEKRCRDGASCSRIPRPGTGRRVRTRDGNDEFAHGTTQTVVHRIRAEALVVRIGVRSASGVGGGAVQGASQPEGRDLVRRLRGGDEDALRILLKDHEPQMLARIRRQLHPGLQSKIDPEDVLQEVYLVVTRRAPSFIGRNDGAFTLWLTRIVDFKVREAMREYLDVSRRDVRRERARGARPNTSRFAGASPTPSQVAMGAELADRARRALEHLSDDYRCVLRLVQVEGTNLQEVSRVMGRSYEAVKKLYGRAITRFRDLLSEETNRAPRG